MTLRNQNLKSLMKRIYSWLPLRIKSLIAKWLGLYPRVTNREVKEIKNVLGTTSWNMSYSVIGKHVELENAFADYIGSEYAVAVGSGGVGIQMLIRALGLNSQSEVIIQADTCSAVPQAILNAQATPIFSDVNRDTFQLCQDDLVRKVGKNTKMILATHMWGNPEDLDSLAALTKENEIIVVEDACLAIGSQYENKYLGSISTAGVFSFGSTKPLQAGEGGMLVTNNKDIAKELRSMRNWGDRETEFGQRDVRTLSWNGRMPEVIAAIALEQLRGYPDRLIRIQERVSKFRELVKEVPDFQITPTLNQQKLAYTQLALKLSPVSRYTKQEFFALASAESIPVFHANFEPLTELSLFRNGDWINWTNSKNKALISNPGDFPGAYDVYQNLGVGLARLNFESNRNYSHLAKFISKHFQ